MTEQYPSSAPLRVIQVGLGGWGRDWARTLAAHPQVCTTLAWVDSSAQALELLQEELGVDASRCFPSLQAALAATPDAEAVLVTTALPGHAPVALEAIAAGKHVLVEKPMAPSLADAHEMVAAAEVAGTRLMVSQNYRFYPAARAVAALIAEGALGAVGDVSVEFRQFGSHHALPDPLLLDMSIHHFDLIRFVLGQEPVSITCHAWNPPWSGFVDPATAAATIELDGGAVVRYHGSWVSTREPTLWAGEWVIECADGAIEWTGRDNTTTDGDAVTIHHRDGTTEAVALPPMSEFDRVGSIAELRDAVRADREPVPSGADNLTTLALTLGALQAARSGVPQHLLTTTLEGRA